MRGQRTRLAGIGTFSGEEFVEAVVDLVRHRVQHVDALGDGHLAPRPLERGASGLDGGIHFVARGLGNLGDHLVGQRRTLFKILAGANELAVDEVLDLFHAYPRNKYQRMFKISRLF